MAKRPPRNLTIDASTTPSARTAINHAVGINAASVTAIGVGNAKADGQAVTADSTIATADGATVTTTPPEAMVLGTGAAPLHVDDAVKGVEIRPNTFVNESKIFQPKITLDQPQPTYFAKEVMRSSSWTGRQSPEEQVSVVRAFAPEAILAADQLCAAIRDRRRNDPADADALEALKELHWAIGELIREAERGSISRAAWKSFEQHRENLTAVAKRGTSLTAAVPVAVGLAQLLSWLSGVPAGETMIATVYAGMIGGEAIRSTRPARKRSR